MPVVAFCDFSFYNNSEDFCEHSVLVRQGKARQGKVEPYKPCLPR